MSAAPSWTLARPDGAEIGVHTLGNGPDLLLVHGTACDHRVWARVARRLASDFTVHAIDRRGRGASDGGSQWSLSRDAGDIQAAAEHLGGSVPVVGHSLGAIASLEAAARGGKLRPIVAYEPPIVGEQGPGVEAADALESLYREKGGAAVVEAFLREVGYTDEQLARLRANDEIWEATLATAPTIPREARAVLGYEIDDELVGAIDVPVLLLDGAESPPHFEAALQRLAQVIPQTRRESVAGATHGVLYEAPGAFVERVTAFLD